ncbi:MAG: Rieske 2Fe-2S domain-containing protein [Acidobacteriota bacterium]|nr:Rieske 2Fe-2S domain-containing protein [Acidobacteriota bacterium]
MTVTPGSGASRLDPEPMPRRDMLGLMSLWSMATAMIFATFGMLRLPKAAVLSSPSKRFRVAIPETLAEGEAFVPPGRTVALFKDAAGVHAISIVCTHLGCMVKPTANGFECPCHGSGFTKDGVVTRGPAPRALDWLKVTMTDGMAVVDEDATVPGGTKVTL